METGINGQPVIDGQEISKFETIDSQYAQGHIYAYVGEQRFKIHVDELIKYVNGIKFSVDSKIKHRYLHVIEDSIPAPEQV